MKFAFPFLLLLTLLANWMAFANAAESLEWGNEVLKKDSAWYASSDARTAADQVVRYQSEIGAWPKNWDLLQEISAEDMETLQNGGKANTIDNEATTVPMQFLALVAHATGESRYKESFTRGLDYLLTAQYENGGWPQYFPLRKGYYSHVTFNDNAMINVMFLLRDVASGEAPYSFISENSAARASEAVSRGLDCVLRTQIKQDGVLTGWGAQYDEKTLEPAWARAYEPPSLSGEETVPIVRFLMEIDQPSAQHIAAIKGAVTWLEEVAIHGFHYERIVDADGKKDAIFIADPEAGRLWARFYEIGSNRPIFLDRDSVVRYSLDEIGQERRGGYAYYGDWAEKLLSRELPRWQKDHTTITASDNQ